MDYPRALDSFPEDRGLGVRDWTRIGFKGFYRISWRDCDSKDFAVRVVFQLCQYDLCLTASSEVGIC